MKNLLIIAAFFLFGAHTVHAADTIPVLPPEAPAVASGQPSWALQITPYMWAAGLDGNISPFRRGPTLAVEKSFSDVMDSLNFGGFLDIWARSDRFIFSGNLMYVSTSENHGTGLLPEITIPGLGSIPAGTSVDAEFDSRQFMATLQGGYRVIDTPQLTLDALAGARFWRISNDVTLTVNLGDGSVNGSYGEKFGWVDPVAGLRVFVPITEKLSLQAQGDIGGFGAGSDLTWSALATLNYVVTDHFSVSAGYKVLNVDYERSGHVFDTRLSGPVLGVTYRF
ncbi:hypothetical protein ACFPLB_11735 [Aquamicrobium segne]|uniref:Outer membrane protein beta-barrel domain-containing protein n=1 Tax=Aquamicrobium segne TaxID=469547 RepID=A0ABW0GY88_9HYPH